MDSQLSSWEGILERCFGVPLYYLPWPMTEVTINGIVAVMAGNLIGTQGTFLDFFAHLFHYLFNPLREGNVKSSFEEIFNRGAWGGILVLAVGILFACMPTKAGAAVFNIHLYSENGPDFTTLESYLHTATGIWETPQEKAIALWRWTVRNHKQTHTTKEDGRGIWDPIMFFNSYPNTYCGYSAGFLETCFEGMGGEWRPRYLQIEGHTVIEASWDSGNTWHLFDPSMAIYCLKPNGVVASAAELTEAHLCPLSEMLGATNSEPGHYYLYHYAPECGTNPANPAFPLDLSYPWGFRSACDNPVPFERTLRAGVDSYLNRITPVTDYTHIRRGWSYRLNLRPFEYYTRFWSHLGETEEFYRPTTRGTDPDGTTPAGGIRGNGRWWFSPDLSTPAYREVVYSEEGVIHSSESGGMGPLVHPSIAGQSAEVLFKVYGANVITSADLQVRGFRSSPEDSFFVSFSRDAGINWQPLWAPEDTGVLVGDIHVPASQIGGAWEYLIRISLFAASENTACGLDALSVTTTTQLNNLTLPKLVRGPNRIHLYLGEQVESHVLWPPLHDQDGVLRYQESAFSFDNVFASDNPVDFYRAVLRPIQGGVPAQVTWKMTTPTPIVGLYYGGSFLTRRVSPHDYVEILHSFDAEEFSWDGRYERAGSSTMDGRLFVDVNEVPADRKNVWLKYEFMSEGDESWQSSGIQEALMYVKYEPKAGDFRPIEVTYCWTEHHENESITREHTQLVDSPEALWQIDVGGFRDPTMNWLRVNLEGSGPLPNPVYGYSNGATIMQSQDRHKVRYVFDLLDNVAYRKPYAVNRPATLNPDTEGKELTNGCAIPPTDLATSSSVQIQTALWEGDEEVVVTLDLEETETVAALRLITHQPNASFCHPENINVQISEDSFNYRDLGVVSHDEIWTAPGDFLDWDNVDSPDYADLPAGGRLAFPFWLVPPVPDSGRFLKLTFVPQVGRGISISEVKVFDSITVEDWPASEILIPDLDPNQVESPEEGPGSEPVLPGRISLWCAPNPFNTGTSVHFDLNEGSSVDLRVFDITGKQVRVLVRIPFRAPGSYQARWDGKDSRGRPVASGVYFCRLETQTRTMTVRMVLVK
jgi:hypothetical protein